MANELQIRLIVKDELSRAMKKAEKNTVSSAKKMQKSFVELAAKMFLVVNAIKAIGRTTKTFIDAASKVESLHTRMEVLFNSVEIGNQVFEDMAKLAAEVPKTYDEIMESATNLAGVIKGGPEELKKLMPIIVDISAATGLGVQETTGQMIRMYSAGIASADMFRERGISAALGFKAGVSVTNKETMDILVQQWEDGTGKFVGAAEALKDDWIGKVSMMSDAWFNFKAEVGKGIIESETTNAFLVAITDGLNQTTEALKFTKESGINLGDVLKATFNVGFYEEMLGFQSSLEQKIIDTSIATEELGKIRIIAEEGLGNTVLITNEHLMEQARLFNEIGLRQQYTKEKAVELEKEYKAVAKSMEKAFSSAFSDMLTGAKTAKEAFADLGKMLIKIIVDYMVQKAVAATIGKALEAAATTLSVTNAAIVASAWAPAAAMVSLASFGANSGPAIAGMTTANIVAATLSKIPAMAEGGIIPATPGGRLIRVAEGGQDEAVVPLDRGMGGGITINIYEPTVRGDSDIDDLAEAMGFQVEEALRTGRG